MSNRRRNNMQQSKTQLPPIINEDDGELPFFKQDFFSDVALIVAGRKLYTSRCLLAYNSPVFEKTLGNAKKHEMELPNKSLDDIVELLSYIDPRVQYTITAQSAKQLLPLSEEYEMLKLRRLCENTLYTTYMNLRKDHRSEPIPFETNEEYLLLADRYGMKDLIQMCVEEYVSNSDVSTAKVAVNSDTLSEHVKLLILKKKLAKLNFYLEKERRYRTEAEMKASLLTPKTNWKKYWHVEEGPAAKSKPASHYSFR